MKLNTYAAGPERESPHLWFLSVTFVQIMIRQTRVSSKQTSALCAATDQKCDIFCQWNFEGMSVNFLLMSVKFPPRLAYKGERIFVDDITLV